MVDISILGCGWLGLPLAEALVSTGYRVKGSTTSETKLEQIASIGVEPFVVSLEDLSDNIENARRFLRSKILIVNVPLKDPDVFKELLILIEASGIEKLLFVSSTSVYSDIDKFIKSSGSAMKSEPATSSSEQIITEDMDISRGANPLLVIEKMFRESGPFMTTIIRFGGLIGYDRQPGRFFPVGRAIPDPEARVNLIHRDDCVRIIENIISQDVWGEVFNCCADSHPTKREFYTKAALDIGVEPPIFEDAVKEESSHSGTESTEIDRTSQDLIRSNNNSRVRTVSKIISNEKVKKRLNYEFKYSDLMRLNWR